MNTVTKVLLIVLAVILAIVGLAYVLEKENSS